MNINTKHLLEQSLDSFQRSVGDLERPIAFLHAKAKPYEGIARVLGIDSLCFIEPEVTSANYARIKRRIDEARASGESQVVLMSSYIPPSLYDDLKQNRINFMDSVGNYFIRHLDGDSTILLVSHSGEKAPEKPASAYPLFKEAGLRVIFYLLRSPERVNQSFRVIKEGSGVSIGTVKNVMDELQARDYLLTSHKKRSLKNARRLLDDWAENYAIVLKPKLRRQRFAFRNAEQKEAWQTLSPPQGMWWGGECAASEKQGYLLPEDFTIYSEVLPAQLMQTGAVRMEEGEITLYEKFWQGDEMPAVLVYSDLVTSGNSRNIEAAERLLEDELSAFK
jgi:hypothetical protein